MKQVWPIFWGLVVVLVFSLYPIRYANSFCCLGVILGGMQSGLILGRNQGLKIETTHAIRVGAYVGIMAAILIAILNFVIGLWWSGALVFDPVPQFIYTFFLRLIEGFFGIAGDAPSLAVNDGPGELGRFLFQIPSNILFGGIGGAIAASLFKQETPIFR